MKAARPGIQPVERFERTYCACSACVAVCKHAPGDLAPGDLEKITDYLGVPLSQEFVIANFRPTTGHQISDPQVLSGETVTVPTIVPAQRPDGRCVFLTSQDQCSIHPVAPFGCSRINACSPVPQQGRLVRSLLRACFSSLAYINRWVQLRMEYAKEEDSQAG